MDIKRKEEVIKSIVSKIWKDPVWSKVIASGILLLFTTIYAQVMELSFYELINQLLFVLDLKVPFYVIFLILGIFYLVKLIKKWTQKRIDPIWTEQIGDYTFEDLYHIMKSQRLQIQTEAMRMRNISPPDENLLICFYLYNSFLSTGVTTETSRGDGGYLWGVLCPKFLGLGLIDKIEVKHPKPGVDFNITKYEINGLGRKFYSLLERINYKEQVQGQTLGSRRCN